VTPILALSEAAWWNIALIGVFFVLFPLLAHGLIGLAAAISFGERAENRREDGPSWRRPKPQK
jgi:cytosine/uracil/thiamine/allantoin permease